MERAERASKALSEPGSSAREHTLFATLVCVAGAASWQSPVQLRGRRSTFPKFGAACKARQDVVAGAARSHGEVQIPSQAPHCRNVRHTFCGRAQNFPKGTEADAALSQGQVQMSWPAQYFREVWPAASRSRTILDRTKELEQKTKYREEQQKKRNKAIKKEIKKETKGTYKEI